MNRILRTLAPITAALACAGSVQAQTMIGGGKTAPTFPIVISQPGSYKLAGNLNVTAAGVPAIQINVPNVSIDLNGFYIQGPNSCTSNWTTKAVTCTLPFDAAASGIAGKEGVAYNVNVFNGAVRGFAGHGVDVPGNLSDLNVSFNTGWGVRGSSGSLTRINATFNAQGGISVSFGTLSYGMAQQNGADGIAAWKSSVGFSTVSSNAGYGLWGMYSVITNVAAIENKTGGLNVAGSLTATNLCNNAPC
jgi:hypothetical protein